jgi:hypothetical protein
LRNLEREFFQDMLDLLKLKRNVILQRPPGAEQIQMLLGDASVQTIPVADSGHAAIEARAVECRHDRRSDRHNHHTPDAALFAGFGR